MWVLLSRYAHENSDGSRHRVHHLESISDSISLWKVQSASYLSKCSKFSWYSRIAFLGCMIFSANCIHVGDCWKLCQMLGHSWKLLLILSKLLSVAHLNNCFKKAISLFQVTFHIHFQWIIFTNIPTIPHMNAIG